MESRQMFSKSILFTKICDCVVGLCLLYPEGHKQFMEEGVATEGVGLEKALCTHTNVASLIPGD